MGAAEGKSAIFVLKYPWFVLNFHSICLIITVNGRGLRFLPKRCLEKNRDMALERNKVWKQRKE